MIRELSQKVEQLTKGGFKVNDCFVKSKQTITYDAKNQTQVKAALKTLNNYAIKIKDID